MMKAASLALLALSLVCAVTGNKLHDAIMNMNENAKSVGPLKQAFATEGADGLDESGPGGQTPLMHAVLLGKKAAVKYLLQKGANVNIPEKDGYSPMHGAGFQGRPEIARHLLDAGVSHTPEPWHPDGFAPLHRACWGNEPRHAQTIAVLVAAGADVDLRTRFGQDKTPFELCRSDECRNVLKALKVRLACETSTCEEEMDAAIEKASGARVDWDWAKGVRAALEASKPHDAPITYAVPTPLTDEL